MSQRPGVGSYRVAVANRFFSPFGNAILIVPFGLELMPVMCAASAIFTCWG